MNYKKASEFSEVDVNGNEIIDAETKPVGDDKPKAAEKPKKAPFSERHPVAVRRVKKVLEIGGIIAGVMGATYAAESFVDRKRTYYSLNCQPKLGETGTYTVTREPDDNRTDTAEVGIDSTSDE